MRYPVSLCVLMLFVTTTAALECEFYIDKIYNYTCALSNVTPNNNYFPHIEGYDNENVESVTTVIEFPQRNPPLTILDGFLLTEFPNLKYFEVGGLGIEEVERTAFDNCGEIVNISMAINGLSNLPPGVFKQCEKLRKLDLGDNKFDQFPTDAFEGLEKLEVLKLYGSNITNVQSENFRYLTGLKELYMSSNQLAVFEVDNLVNVEAIYLNRNKLDHFVVKNFPKLRYLELTESRIKDFKIIGAGSLESLDISQNQLSNLTNGIFKNAGNLKSLTLSENPDLLHTLDRMFFDGLINLEILEMNTCGIEKLTRFPFTFIEHLKELHLSHNKINELSHIFSNRNARKLEVLRIPSNMLMEIRAASFGRLPALKILDLSHNFIEKIEQNSFRSMNNLEMLDLSSNQLKILEFTIFPRPNDHFVELDVSYNCLESIEINFFKKFSNLLTFNGYGNKCISQNIQNIGLISPDVFAKCYENYKNGFLTTTTEATSTEVSNNNDRIEFTGEDLLIILVCIIFIALLMIILVYYINGLLGLRMMNEKAVANVENKPIDQQRF